MHIADQNDHPLRSKVITSAIERDRSLRLKMITLR